METAAQQYDIAILGGGVAGLWLLNRLRLNGYSVLLVDSQQLGSGQTLASQGMIHGGIKYALGGKLTSASETIASMPDRWQACLEGRGELDLRDVKLMSEDYYLFSDGSLTSNVTAFFGSKAVKGRVTAVKDNLPEIFCHKNFKGRVYRLQDVVIDTPSLIASLARSSEGSIYTGEYHLTQKEGVFNLSLTALTQQVSATHMILCAGEGNGPLIEQLKLPVSMQLRPLNQVTVKGEHLPEVYAHAVSLRAGDKPRVTITTHGDTWYLGGELAETGVNRSDEEQVRKAKQELDDLFPWLNFDTCEFSTLRINRAEAGQTEGQRPDTPFVKTCSNVTTCFPTKLTLVPLMGDEVLNQLAHLPSEIPGQISSQNQTQTPLNHSPTIAKYPWIKT